MKSPFHIIPLVFLSMSLAHAGSERACEDLNKLSCAPGDYDDGTGVAHRPNDEQEKTISAKIAASAGQAFKEELKKPDASYFRKIVLSATGLSLAPQCDDAEENPSEDCLNRMSEGASDIATRFLRGQIPRSSATDIAQGKYKDAYYLISSEPFTKIKDQLIKEAQSSISSDEQQKKIAEDIFPKMKKLIEKRLDQYVQDPERKRKLIEKVEAIKFSGQDCMSMGGNNAIAGVLTNNAAYNPLSNTFKYCAGFNTTSTSAFTMAFIIAHELSHSIDPCGVTMGPSDYALQYNAKMRIEAESQFPVGRAITCLRGLNSVAAIAQPLAPYYGTVMNARMGGYGGGNNGYDGGTPTGTGYYNPNTAYTGNTPSGQMYVPYTSFCDRDQITESFADWMAMEVMPEYVSTFHSGLSVTQRRLGYSNIYRVMCEEGERNYFDVHPETELRANALALTNPNVRKQMGCSGPHSKYVYCDPDGDALDFDPSTDNSMPCAPGAEGINRNPYGQPCTPKTKKLSHLPPQSHDNRNATPNSSESSK